jgi:hypothetical protein
LDDAEEREKLRRDSRDCPGRFIELLQSRAVWAWSEMERP